MPENPMEMQKYERMLDELASEYPELEEEAMALAGKMAEMDPEAEEPMMDDEEDFDLEDEEGALPELPADLMDEEEDEELF